MTKSAHGRGGGVVAICVSSSISGCFKYFLEGYGCSSAEVAAGDEWWGDRFCFYTSTLA